MLWATPCIGTQEDAYLNAMSDENRGKNFTYSDHGRKSVQDNGGLHQEWDPVSDSPGTIGLTTRNLTDSEGGGANSTLRENLYGRRRSDQ
jgi:hypothetical protein